MKKKIVMFNTLILCCFAVFTQNKMDEAVFAHLVDYANCKYLMAFIEMNDAGKPYIKDSYEKSISPNLQQQHNALQNDSKIVSMQGAISTLQLVVVFCLAVIILFIVALFLWYKSQFNSKNRNSSVRAFVKNVFFTSEEIREKFANIGGGNNGVGIFEDKLNNLERKFGVLQSEVNSIKTIKNQNTVYQTITQSTPQPANSSVSKNNGLYFASKSNTQLTEQLPNSANASFRVFAIIGNEAKFEYIGTVKNENWFEGVCLIENSASDNLSDKKQIKTTQSGKVENKNNKWVVVTHAIIKFV